MRRIHWSVKVLLIMLVVGGAYVGTEYSLSRHEKTGIYPNVKRILAGAPVVTAYGGHALNYVDTVQAEMDDLEKFVYGDGMYKDRLYKANRTPDKPPYIFLRKEGNTYYKYKYPSFALGV
ncbi:hypothetical protein ACE3MZ_13865 [Paenibacillus sp. WLX1005]|uniref:hypothetical protein n=1 Tax=Paenibacillus sp. WLX1005 TaxID=3243766 RepID=UPI0039841693